MDSQTLDAEQLRTTLERTLFMAEQRGLVCGTESGWEHQDGPLVISYCPSTDVLQFINQATSQILSWQGEHLVESAQITPQQAAEFQDLSAWLDREGVPTFVNLAEWEDAQLPMPEDLASLNQTAEQLFEHYAAQGEPAFKLSADATIDYYNIELSGNNYFLSRDEASGSYNLQRQDTNLSLSNPHTVTRQDVEIWAGVADWLASEAVEAQPETGSSTYWEQHQMQLGQITPVAEQFLSFQESIGETWIDPGELYSTSVGQYTIGYAPDTEQTLVHRGEVDLQEVGCITQQDIEFFQSLGQWLDERESLNATPQSFVIPQSDPSEKGNSPWQNQRQDGEGLDI